jgi:hypothetical protein
MHRVVLCVLGVVAFAAPAYATQEAIVAALVAEQEAKSKPAPGTAQAEKQEQPKVAYPDAPQRPGELANVRLEITITDQRATGQPTTKTVSLTLADRSGGRIRTTGEVPVPVKTPGGIDNFHMRSIVLNVDAHPELTRDGRIRTQMTLEYRPTGSEPSTEEQLTTISESFTVLLENGKPLIASQSADPNTDRRVRVEVKATVLK